jgi:peptidoglycan/xylan/chitin deacetylase (PgdA/CDA1 family)
VIAKRSVDQIIQDAKKYTVLRDTWASYFMHDILLNTVNDNGLAKEPGDTSELRRLIQAIKDDGYEFVDLKKWTAAHRNIKHLKPIEIDPPGGTCSGLTSL